MRVPHLPKPPVPLNAIIQGLAFFSIGLGLAELLAPRRVSRAAGMTKNDTLLRGYGLREIATGVGLLVARNPRPWLWGRWPATCWTWRPLLAPPIRENPGVWASPSRPCSVSDCSMFTPRSSQSRNGPALRAAILSAGGTIATAVASRASPMRCVARRVPRQSRRSAPPPNSQLLSLATALGEASPLRRSPTRPVWSALRARRPLPVLQPRSGRCDLGPRRASSAP